MSVGRQKVTMATADHGPAKILRDEAKCPICLEFFSEPVVTGCGHNFCRDCIKQHLGEQGDSGFPCPLCREVCFLDRVKPNRLLVSVVEAAKQMEATKNQVDNVCQLHKEELKLYCDDDKKAVCTVCVSSREHHHHSVLPIEEAAEDYKEIFEIYLGQLISKLKDLIKRRSNDEERISNLRKEIEAQRTYIKSEMEKLRHLVNDQEQMLLQKLDTTKSSLSMAEADVIGKISEEIHSLGKLMFELQATCRKPAKELMKDTKDMLNRIREELHEYEDFIKNPECEAVDGSEELKAEKMYEPQLPARNQKSESSNGRKGVQEEQLDESPVESQLQPGNQKGESSNGRKGMQEEQLDESPVESQLQPSESPYEDMEPERKPWNKENILKRIRLSGKKMLERLNKGSKPQATGNSKFHCDLGQQAIAIYYYEAEHDDDLSFVEGDIITDIDPVDEGWWYGSCNGKYGLLPANYVALL